MSIPSADAAAEPRPGRLAQIVRLAFSKVMLTLAGQGLVSAGNFMASVLIGRGSREELGLYVLAFTIVLFAVNSQTALITSPYTVFHPGMRKKRRRVYTGSTLLHQICLALLLMAGVFTAGLLLRRAAGPTELPPVLFVVSAVIGVMMLKEYARHLCFARLHSGTALALDTFVTAVQVGGLGWLAYRGELTAARAFLVVGLGSAMAGLTWLAFRRRAFTPRIAWAVRDLRKNWGFGKWLLAQNFALVAASQLYPWVLTAFHGTEATGVFGACMAIVFLSNPFILGMSNFLGPKTAHAYTEGGVRGMRKVVWRGDLFFAVTMGLLCLIMFVAGGRLVEWIYGPEYAGLGMTITLLALSQLAWSYTIPANFGLNAMKRPDVAFKSLLLALLVTLTAGIWLVKAYGPPGVAVGMLLGNIAATAFNRWMYTRESRNRFALESTAE